MSGLNTFAESSKILQIEKRESERRKMIQFEEFFITITFFILTLLLHSENVSLLTVAVIVCRNADAAAAVVDFCYQSDEISGANDENAYEMFDETNKSKYRRWLTNKRKYQQLLLL